MKSPTSKFNINLTIAIILLVTSFPALTITGDTEQPIHIESDMQSIDMQSHLVTFTGNVIMTQGTIKVNTDKLSVVNPGKERDKEIIDGYGNPAILYQMQDNGKPVKGHASHIHYELSKDLLILTGNAYLEQLDSNIAGDNILYSVKKQTIQAYGEKGNRVTAVFIPSQLQDKNKGHFSIQKKSN